MNQQDAPGLKNDCPEQLLDARHEGTSSWGRAEQTPLSSAMFPRYNILASGGLEIVTFTKSPTETRPMHRCQSRTRRSEESIATAGAYADLTRRVRRASEQPGGKALPHTVETVESRSSAREPFEDSTVREVGRGFSGIASTGSRLGHGVWGGLKAYIKNSFCCFNASWSHCT